MYNGYPQSYIYPQLAQQTYFDRLQALQQQNAPMQNMQLIRVNGIDGAKAFQMPPNSSVALFDTNNDVFFVKSTDGAGFGSIRTFTFIPAPDAQPQMQQASPEYVTRAEFDELKGMVLSNGKQPVRTNRKQQPADDAAE